MSHGEPSGRSEEELLIALIHDLRRHLRTSVARTQMIERELTPPITPSLRAHLNDVIAAGRSMDLLLTRVAQYAAATSEEEPHPRGDVGVMFESALRRLAGRNTAAEIDADPIRSCGIKAPYATEIVLRELLDNALKFREGGVKITLRIQQSHENYVFAVQDTGIGFDPKYSERIMLPLERLHPPDVYGGFGMGLAICRKLVSSFGGKLWAESKLNEGSTFWFTLPV